MNSVAVPLRVAALLAALEGVGLGLLGALYAVRAVLDDPQSRAGTLLGALLVAGTGAVLLLAARALAAGRRWARSPVVVVQLLALLTAFSLAQGRVYAVAAVLAVLAAAVLALLATPGARTVFDGPR